VIIFFWRPTQLLTAQVDAVLRDPGELMQAPHPIIYHALLSPTANKGRPLPSRQSLLDEAAILLGAGSDSTGVTLMVTAHYLLQNPLARQRLDAELREAWPVLDEVPPYEVLEKLPYLVRTVVPNVFSYEKTRGLRFSRRFLTNILFAPYLCVCVQAAVTKEGLRMFPGVIAHPRVVPREGAVISGTFIPGGVRFAPSLPLTPTHLIASFFSHTGFHSRVRRTRRPSWARVSVTCTARH